MEVVATILKNDSEVDRIGLCIEKDADGYYVATDSGEDASQYRFASADEARAAIDTMWGSSAWDLIWE